MVRSALVGQPPATDEDLWIVKGNLLLTGLTKLDPHKGLMIPPFRPPPDKYHFQTRQPAIIAVSSVLIVVMLVITVARLLLRRLKKEMKFGPDDWLMIPALILALLWPILQIAQAKVAGAGKHVYDVSYHELYMANWIGSFAKIDFYVALGLVKLSIVSFNMRLTGLSSRKWMYAHWAFFAAIIMHMIAATFLTTFQCVPVVGAWDTIATAHLDKKPKCLSEEQINNPLIITHIIMDFCLLAVPIVVLYKLQMASAIKIRLYLLFSVGCLTCFAAIMRKVSQDQLKKDVTYNITALIYWTELDMTLTVVVASLPVLGTLLLSQASSRKPSKPSGVSSSFGISSKPKGSQVLSSQSREGIIRQDEIELEYHSRDPRYAEEGIGGPGRDTYYIDPQAKHWDAR